MNATEINFVCAESLKRLNALFAAQTAVQESVELLKRLVENVDGHTPRPDMAKVREAVKQAVGKVPSPMLNPKTGTRMGGDMDVGPHIVDRILTALAPFLNAPTAPATSDMGTLDDIAKWLDGKISATEKAVFSREQSANVFREGTNAEWAAAADMHPLTSGNRSTKAERLKEAAIQDRIADKLRRELKMFTDLRAHLSAAPAHPGTTDAERLILQKIVDSYDMRDELFTSDADCAANLAAHARQYLRAAMASGKKEGA